MAQIYNAGNDFVQAFSRGVQDRLDHEKQLLEAKKWQDELPLRKAETQARVDAVRQQGEAAQAEIGSHVENLKHQLMADFASGIRQPSADSLQPNVDIQQSQQNGLQDNFQDPSRPDINAIRNLPTTQQNLGLNLTPDSSQNVNVDPRLVPGGQINLKGVSFPRDMRKEHMLDIIYEAKKAGMISEAKEAPITRGKLLVQDSKNTNDKEVAQIHGQTQLDVANVNKEAAKEIAADNAKAALARTTLTVNGGIIKEGMRDAALRYAADHKSTADLDPQVIEDNAMMAAMGHAKFPSYTKQGMAVQSVLKKNNLVAFDPEDAKKLKAVNDVGTLFDYLETNIKNLPESKIGAFIQMMQAKIPGTDVSAIHNAVFGRAGNMSHQYGGEVGRLTDTDITRIMGILGSVGSGVTKAQGLAQIQMLKSETTGKVLDNILGGQSAKQQLMILEGYENQGNKLDPESFYVKGKDQQLHQKFQKGRDGRWGVFVPKDMKYIPVNGDK